MSALLAYGEFSHIKCVPAYEMMADDLQNGLYDGKHTIVVDSSGNTAWAVARLARGFGFTDVKVVMASDVPASKQDIFRALSTVEVVSVPKGMSVSDRAKEEGQKPGHYHLNQYAHLSNAHAHELYTGPEIERVLDANIGVIAIAMGSGGTAAGVARYMREYFPDAIVLGVRPMLGQQVPGARDGAKMEAVVPPECRPKIEQVVDVSRRDAFVATRQLWRDVEPQPGPTSGLAYAGLLQYLYFLAALPCGLEALEGKNCAFICPDSAVLYSDVIIAELDSGHGI